MKRFILAATILFAALNAKADDKVLLTIDGEPVYQSEFEYLYTKNNASTIVEDKNYNEYLDLFVNFKLKVTEAKRQGLDTLTSFKKELSGYRKELAKPYLTDTKLQEDMYREAYSHFAQDCEVSHILIMMPQQATPADTLKAYNRAMEAHNRIKAGEDFGTVATEMSDDRSVAQNKGYLGYYTALQLVWSFENAMYSLPLNTISQPIRSDYGYHVILVHNRRPARGEVHARHIMVSCNENMTKEQKDKAYEKILNIEKQLNEGADFAEIAKKQSDDRNSANRGGELPWFGIHYMQQSFEDAAFALEKGEISKPVQTKNGWHIIKLIDKRSVEPYEKKKAAIHRMMQYDSRSTAAKESFLASVRKEYNFRLDTALYNATIELIEKNKESDSALMASISGNKSIIATFADRAISQSQAISSYIVGNRKQSVKAIVDEMIEQQLIAYEDRQLERKYPEFANLIREYHDGILLFAISKNEIWDKGTQDTAGIETFFNSNRAKYAWQSPRFKGFVVCCADARTAKAVRKEIKVLPTDSVIKVITRKYNTDDNIRVQIERGLWKEGDNSFVDKQVFKNKIAAQAPENLPVVFTFGKKLKKLPEAYTDVRGSVTADYQNHLEAQWIESLKNKYTVVIDQEVFESIKNR